MKAQINEKSNKQRNPPVHTGGYLCIADNTEVDNFFISIYDKDVKSNFFD